jgi:quercetin 2,3-dioxygenase
MVEINLEPHASAEQDIPGSYNGFAFVIDGSVQIGDTVLNTDQVGWLDRPSETGTSVLSMVADESGARLILYAGQPQGDPIVSYGPFMGDSKKDIARLFAEYQAGKFSHLRGIDKAARLERSARKQSTLVTHIGTPNVDLWNVIGRFPSSWMTGNTEVGYIAH